MGDAARIQAPMTADEFLKWDSGDDFVWELIDGYPKLKFAPNPDFLGQAAPSDDHGVIVKNLTFLFETSVRAKRRPCRVIPGPGQKVRRTRERVRIPDLAVKCGNSSRDATDPIIVAEVMSPSNSFREMDERMADYRSLESVREILVLDQDAANVTLHRRVGDLWRVERLEGLDAVLTLETFDLSVTLSEIYRDVLSDDETDAA